MAPAINYRYPLDAVWALFTERTQTIAPYHAGPVLEFALDVVAVLQKLVGSLDTEPDNGSSKGFLVPLGPELANVHERLEQLASSGTCVPGSDLEKRIFKLLTVLENLVSWPSTMKPSPSPPDLPFSAFTRKNYVALRSLISESQDAEKDDKALLVASQPKARGHILELARSFKERAAKDRQKFLTSLSAFSGKRRPAKALPLSKIIELNALECSEEVKKRREKLRTVCADSLRLLHAALHKCSSQVNTCGVGFTANIALRRIKRLDETNDEMLFFDCFFLHPHLSESRPGADGWKQAQFKVFIQSDTDESCPTRKVHFSDDQPGRVVKPHEFCTLIRLPVAACLLLNVTKDTLIYDGPDLPVSDDDMPREFLLYDPSVSLATVLENRKLQDARHRLLLSYLLAKAVWQFYESDWMTPSWTKHAIHFMREKARGQGMSEDILTLLHKPYFTTELWSSSSSHDCQSGESSPSREFSTTTHFHPKILALGIMLLEIELGETIDRDLQKTFEKYRGPTDDAEHITAWQIAEDARRFNTYEALKQIIQSCLRPDRGKFGRHMDEASLRDSLYTNVVAPLETLCKQAWHQKGEPESFDPEPIQFKPTELPPSNIETPQVKLKPETPHRVVRNSPQGNSASPYPNPQITSSPSANPGTGQPRAKFEPSIPKGGQLSANNHDEEISVMRRKADEWFKNFQKLQLKVGRGQKIKVAVLDSGIDISYGGFRPSDQFRIEETRTFIGGSPDEDQTGHGTHVAATILRLTEGKNVELYIAKITDSHEVDKTEEIAEAIDFARTEWKVDIISLSFGFRDAQPSIQRGQLIDRIGQAVQDCVAENIIVFASASNDGGEGPRTYPAMYPQVICAHATDYLGNSSRFNPDPLERGDNFSFVGEHVRPVWSSENTMDSNNQGTAYVSGTSFATPVAVSIAIFMLGYINKEMQHTSWQIHPKSPQGMTKIFRMLANKRGEYDWVSPTRYFKDNDKEFIKAKLKRELAWRGEHHFCT